MLDQLKPIKDIAQKGDFNAALQQLDMLESSLQAEPDALYLRAVCQRGSGQLSNAVQTLETLLEIDNGYVRAYQELGNVHVAQQKARPAITAFTNAVQRDPALLSSWQSLVSLHKITGDQKASKDALVQVKTLQSLPTALLAVKSQINQGNLDRADRLCRHFLKDNKQHIEAMRLLAEIATRANILDDAEFILDSAVEFAPDHVGARLDLAAILLKRQKFGRADDLAQQLSKEQPENLDFKSLLASTRLGVGDTQTACDLFAELTDKDYQPKSSWLLLGHALKTAGDFNGAVASYQSLYEKFPDYGDAFWSLANTKTYQFSDAEITHMQEYEENKSTSKEDRVHLCFALGKAHEDAKDFDRAFEYYRRGNDLNREMLDYQAPDMVRRAERQIKVCTPSLFEQHAGCGDKSQEPIFIVGLPRAGSTLLEQILASHSEVDGTHELPNIMSLARRLRGRGAPPEGEEPAYPAILGDLESDYFARFGKQYIDDTRVFRQGGAHFIDKMPNNFLHLGLIKLMLPNAKVIDARRHPMSCCFSGFKQLFAEGQEFTYGLHEIGSYYRAYVELMDHWDSVLPGFVLRVQHEDVVEDLETQVRRILDFCDLEFEPACLEFHKTERNIRTPSSEQVRQPIFKTGLQHWRNFEHHLQPLREALGEDVMQRYPS